MDSRKLVGSVLLDLSKAFDLVDHDLLLSKIDKYHITNTSQEWFKSYLSLAYKGLIDGRLLQTALEGFDFRGRIAMKSVVTVNTIPVFALFVLIVICILFTRQSPLDIHY